MLFKHLTRGILRFSSNSRYLSTSKQEEIELLGNKYKTDEWTNISSSIKSKLGQNLYQRKYHPLNHLTNQIKNHFYKSYINRFGNPLFSIHDNLSPVVTLAQNFDSLQVPSDHPSRSKSDCYYVNKEYLLRAHTSAHQYELIKSGLNSFLVIGDVYRRDEIDAKHYPVFHQCEGVSLFNKYDLFKNEHHQQELNLFEREVAFKGVNKRLQLKQEWHTLEAVKLVEHNLKKCLLNLVKALFGTTCLNYKWIDTQFPFTHPSWELEIEYNGQWYEVLGCGIIEQSILSNAGVSDQIGWAFGIGLERIAMILYGIPDIRVFWSNDPGVLGQFKFDDSSKIIKYKQVSVHPPVLNDISFWLSTTRAFDSNSFYDLVRELGHDKVEQVELKDVFYSEKKNSLVIATEFTIDAWIVL